MSILELLMWAVLAAAGFYSLYRMNRRSNHLKRAAWVALTSGAFIMFAEAAARVVGGGS